ncbi:type I-U CRISPR-associated helicase/endonuclease Cas3 [Asticcacaulis sp.]|uniref:type I-G CRISPR-associated helicase/endonuclease Cas3g n=1 Tax=Asticcacaulis sp. TaxID=1872648 RepID=UPI00262FDF97|nr:type I-U CRISPR-associated helicase/endonuclease Cas3 [Asticcacaulis sp.]
MSALTPDDFTGFFREVNGYPPFPWQQRLLTQLATHGRWPDCLGLPTGTGKTACLDIALFHLALEVGKPSGRQAPVRIAFVVDRRLVVDDAFERARRLADALAAPAGPVTARVADRLRLLSGDGPPLLARRLRGGIPREDDWARTPAQPTILCSTVDQVGSRLLFRGYGVTDRAKPIHAGLLGADCLILLDEAHLAEPFRQTLGWVGHYRRNHDTAWGLSVLSATPRADGMSATFGLNEDDWANRELAKRLTAAKPVRLVGGKDALTETRRAEAVAAEAQRMLDALRAGGIAQPALGVVVNRVDRARRVFKALEGVAAERLLLIGPSRSVDREDLVRVLDRVRTGRDRDTTAPLLIVATQCIEAGVDIDLDGLVTELAPLDALRQRFGRVNRAGRPIPAQGVILATKQELSARYDDPVYGDALRPCWDWLSGLSSVDFGIQAMAAALLDFPPPAPALSPQPDAPVLMPALLDLFSQTSPIPSPTLETSLFLHGPKHQPDGVTLVWRGDVTPGFPEKVSMRRLLTLVPPRAGEAVSLPVWTVRRWLEGQGTDALADIPAPAPEDEEGKTARSVFLWRGGDDEASRWIAAHEISPGDTIIVPATYGGLDNQYGWDPGNEDPVRDVARKAAQDFAGRRFAVRVAPGLIPADKEGEDLLAVLAALEGERDPARLCAALAPYDGADDLAWLWARLGDRKLDPIWDVYGRDTVGRPLGVVLLAPSDVLAAPDTDGAAAVTEDDLAGSLSGFPLLLLTHSEDVAGFAADFARRAGLPPARVQDLWLAGYLHDAGKCDPRFQEWLAAGDPLGADPDHVLAKSARKLPPDAKEKAGLPSGWRHEVLSVRLAACSRRLAERRSEGGDPDLILWLIGTHHGFGRPFFAHLDPQPRTDLLPVPALWDKAPTAVGPEALDFDHDGLDWHGLLDRLKQRYGPWGLAHMEAILRLADHRASEYAAKKGGA